MPPAHDAVAIRPATAADAAAIAAIWNEGIALRGATFETEPRGAAEVLARLGGARHPWLVAVAPGGRVLGWAGLAPYSPRACYAGVAEFSIYLAAGARGQGLGARLLDALVEAARQAGHWKLLGKVFPGNAASRALCRRAGFREVGLHLRHARLDGRWLDVVLVERLIGENQPGA